MSTTRRHGAPRRTLQESAGPARAASCRWRPANGRPCGRARGAVGRPATTAAGSAVGRRASAGPRSIQRRPPHEPRYLWPVTRGGSPALPLAEMRASSLSAFPKRTPDALVPGVCSTHLGTMEPCPADEGLPGGTPCWTVGDSLLPELTGGTPAICIPTEDRGDERRKARRPAIEIVARPGDRP